MPILHLVRHAKAGRDDPSLDDHERPLAPRGRKAAPEMARWMAANGVAPGLVLVSTARRCRETWAAMQPSFAGSPEVAFEDGLYLASAEELLDRIRKLPPARGEAMLIGHNPGLHDLAIRLGSGKGAERDRLVEKFSTAALCSLSVAGQGWAEAGRGGGTLIRFVRPSDISDSS